MLAVFTDTISEVTEILNAIEIISMQSRVQSEIYKVTLRNSAVEPELTPKTLQRSTKSAFDDFLLVSTGCGKANIGVAFESAVSQYNIDNIVGVGNCGVLKDANPTLGQIIISRSSTQYDVNFSSIGTSEPMLVNINMPEYLADPELIELARKCASEKNMTSMTTKFGSADQFMASNKKSTTINEKFNVFAYDTECGVIGELAVMSKVPYVYVKSISNYADNDAGEMYFKYRACANCMSQSIVLDMIKELTLQI